ncbi:MAG: hypothetical protein LBG46_00680 [Elusimicrobiota bacterium]|jgi:hypothetical protein|nr:hypothetical protein [Elusimicrobiota bacterium]
MIQENKYIEFFLEPIRKCKDYKPKFGESQNPEGLTIEGFLNIYGRDPFYSWIGLDSKLMYSAHKAAGGMTSIYRQIGVGCEHLFREIIVDTAKYEKRELAQWSYETKTQSGKTKTLTLDGRLELNAINNIELKNCLSEWIKAYCKELSVKQIPQNGVVFEVRQGYKSKDSKRQNADIDNATVAYANGYLPIFAIFSSQIDSDIMLRYRNNRCGIITGSNSNNPLISLFTFSKEILGYDLAAFFQKNSKKFKQEINSVLRVLLYAS